MDNTVALWHTLHVPSLVQIADLLTKLLFQCDVKEARSTVMLGIRVAPIWAETMANGKQ